ncbi:MAG: preprotein translocase subunit YajC [Silvanigrellales bacterium]|jgi:preprotein translocase subunit YajC|nr:preprotein translocase subunit YajC [Silvanigrellales bacterium]
MKHVLFFAALSAATSMSAFAQETTGGPVLTPGTTAASSSAGAPPPWLNFVLFGGMIVFMWLFIIRPNAKRQKEHKAFVESLSPGKEVVTSSGLIGKITTVADTTVTLDLGTTTVRVLKSAVSGELGRPTAAGTPAKATT